MSIVRWEPFRDLLTTQDRFNRLFNQTFSQAFGDEEGKHGAWAPPVDIFETGQNLVFKAELAGVDPNDVEVRVENNTLFLKGQRKFESEVKEENYHRIERSYGTFTRTFSLPGTVDANHVVAEFKNGLLTLTLPKREEAKPKTIKIHVAGETPKAMAAGAQK